MTSLKCYITDKFPLITEGEREKLLQYALISTLTSSFGRIKKSNQFLLSLLFQSITCRALRYYLTPRLSRIMIDLQRISHFYPFSEKYRLPSQMVNYISPRKGLIFHSWDQMLIHSGCTVHRIGRQMLWYWSWFASKRGTSIASFSKPTEQTVGFVSLCVGGEMGRVFPCFLNRRIRYLSARFTQLLSQCWPVWNSHSF